MSVRNMLHCLLSCVIWVLNLHKCLYSNNFALYLIHGLVIWEWGHSGRFHAAVSNWSLFSVSYFIYSCINFLVDRNASYLCLWNLLIICLLFPGYISSWPRPSSSLVSISAVCYDLVSLEVFYFIVDALRTI